MNKEEIKNFLENDPEGRELLQEMTSGLKDNRDTILAEKKELKTEYETLMERVGVLESRNQQLMIEKNTEYVDSSIRKQADIMGIIPTLKDPFLKMLKTENLSLGEDNKTVMVGSVSLDQWSKEFSDTATGKSMIKAPINSGGGGKGSSLSSGGGGFAEQILNTL